MLRVLSSSGVSGGGQAHYQEKKKVWQNSTFPLSPHFHAIDSRFGRNFHISYGTGTQQEAPMQGDVSDKDGRPVKSQTK